ncbi:MAG: T9SS C-terminal target domain-containing protein, partial [Sphingobacteriia bacterium]|nr:T9SS C-terminal target domain-containing protein [Candidatus Fonsibacter lacus]
EEDLIFKNKTASVKTDDLENGVYFLKLHGTNSQTVSKRFVINR